MLIQKEYNKLILLEILKNNVAMSFIIEESKKAVFGFSKGTVKVLWFYSILTQY